MNKKLIYTLPEKKINRIVDTYIDYVSNPYCIWRQPETFWDAEFNRAPIPTQAEPLTVERNCIGELHPVIENLAKPQKEKIRAHFISLLHQLYVRYISSENPVFSLNTAILQKQYRYYNYMLDVLSFCYVLQGNGWGYYAFVEPDTFHLKQCAHKVVLDDLERLVNIFEGLHQEKIKIAVERSSPTFVEKYNANIRQLQISNASGLAEFMEKHVFSSNHSKLHYQYVVEKIKNKEIKEIDGSDSNGRFYHIGTQLPKLLKPYTNIQYSIDCKNSHLLLFNYFILSYYLNYSINIYSNFTNNLSINSLYTILSSFLNTNNPYNNFHYFMQELCKELENKGIENDQITHIRKIPKDAWQYMYSTSSGLLWDEFTSMYPHVSREEVKRTMFAKVFYSYAKNVKKDNLWATAFKEKYPSVMKIIRHYKRTFHAQCVEHREIKSCAEYTKDKIQLPHKLMQLESAVFTKILEQLFKKRGLHIIAIHDAIAVMNDKLETVKIKKIMLDEYRKFGLIPTLAVEEYNR